MIFDRQATPHRAMLRWCWALALIACAGTGFLLPLLIPAPHISMWGLVGLLIGAAFGWMIIASVAAGTRITINDEGVLSYHLGRKENLRVPLSAISGWGAVDTGILKGIGANCPLDAIEILHRKGVRIPQLRDQQRELGFALVFEFHDPADIPELEELTKRGREERDTEDREGTEDTEMGEK